MPVNVLVIRLSSLGDILHSSVILNPIKKKFPNSTISWLSEKRNFSILATIREIDKIYSIDNDFDLLNFSQKIKEIFSLMKKIRKQKYDYVIDIQGLFKSGVLTFLSKAKFKIGFSKSNSREFSYFFYNQRIKTKFIQNIFLKNLKLLEGMKIKELEFKRTFPNFKIPSNNSKINGYLSGLEKQKKWVLINPWSSFKNKNIPTRNLNLIIKKLNVTYQIKPLLIYSASKELAKLKEMARKTFFFIVPKMNLLELMYLIKKSNLYLGVDSGPSYISFLLKKKTIILFGPTNLNRQAPPGDFNHLEKIYSSYDCPIIKKEPILTAYRCLNRNCLNNLCMKKYTPSSIPLEKFLS